MKNLFIIGAQRSGSTYLYKLLDDHPEVSMAHPVRPEPKFFLSEQCVARGREYYEQTYFCDRKDGTIYLGEKSTSYIESRESARRIKDVYSDARILVVLRDPVSRAYSNYRFSVAHGLEKMTFLQALRAEPERLDEAKFSTSVSPFAYRKRGNYIDYIETYLEIFNSSQVRVLIFEELVNSPQEVQALYQWLGVTSSFLPPSLHRIFNPATAPEMEQKTAFYDLAMGYQSSIERLERLLGRQIAAWSEHHQQIYAASK